MTPPIGTSSESGTFADKIREMGANTETLPPTPPSCDLSPVDLRPFKDLPPEWLVVIDKYIPWRGDPINSYIWRPKLDPSIMEGYEKLDRYFEIDAQREFRSGNGDGILQAEEVEAYKATRGLHYGEDICSLMKEARQFSSQGAETFKEKIPECPKDTKECIAANIFVLAIGFIGLWGLYERWKGPPSSGGGTTPSKGGNSISSVQEAPKSATSSSASNFVVTDLIGQIHQMYGGAVYTGLSPTTLDSLSSHGKAPALGIVPLVTPLPLTLPEVRPLPVFRPVPVTVAP